MNKNIKMFVICAVFVLISSCKNYTISKDLKNLEQNAKEKVEGFLDTKKEELTEGIKSLGSKVSAKVQEKLMQADEPQGQLQQQISQGVAENPEFKEIEKKTKELKDKIEKSDDKTTLGTYYEYEEEIKKLKKELEEKLKDKKEDKEKLEKELETLEKTLKEKIEKRKKALEEAQKKFQEYKQQFGISTGQTQGDKAKNQGKIGLEAFNYAKEFGLTVSYSNSDNTDTGNMSSGIIDGALKKIEEELSNSIEDSGKEKKE